MPKKNQGPSLESLSMIDDDGSRKFIQPADVQGKFTTYRRIFAVFLIVVYIALPWIQINGFPAVFLDLAHRRFHFFGMTVVQQDLWLGFFLITGLGFSLFFLTALFGRLWCGWACPQTVFLEHVFRRIERIIEGDAPARKKLQKLSWTNPEKLRKTGLKQVIFLGVSFLITHILLSYFVSLPRLYEMMKHDPAENWRAFVFVMIATGILYFNFTWFREQLCVIICPYGRVQSVLIDDHSVNIGYDEKRGEPRGKKGEGDCVACNRCISVCPTGIDIRNGVQLECIGCSACIDACDAIMEKVGKPKGLIRYDSLHGLEGRKTKFLRPRIFIYLFLMLAGLSMATYSFSTLRPATLDIARMPGSPFVVADNLVRNQFFIRVINKTNKEQTYDVVVEGVPEGIQVIGANEPVTVSPMAEVKHPFIMLAPKAIYSGEFSVNVMLASDGKSSASLSQKINFLGPNPELLKASK